MPSDPMIEREVAAEFLRWIQSGQPSQPTSGLLEALQQAFLGLSSAKTEDEKQRILFDVYSTLVGEYIPFVGLIPSLVALAWEDLEPLLKSAIKGVHGIAIRLSQDESVQAVVREARLVKARSRMALLNTYIEEGFLRHEALALVLQDEANLKAMPSQFAEALKNNLNALNRSKR